jgi:hypothetical protein
MTRLQFIMFNAAKHQQGLTNQQRQEIELLNARLEKFAQKR